jgi:hypothetical protein
MTKLGRIGWAAASWRLANVVSYPVLASNLKNGVYSPDADIIIIPLFENAIVSTVVMALVAPSIFCSGRSVVFTVRVLRWGCLPAVLPGFRPLGGWCQTTIPLPQHSGPPR